MSKRSGSYSFRVIQASWGLAVDISGYFVRYFDFGGEVAPIAEGIYLAVIPSHLNDGERDWLRQGVEMMSTVLLRESSFREDTVLVVSDVSFNPCDFQPEALACAVRGLVGELLCIDVPRVTVVFNKEKNRYDFDFAGLKAG